MQYYPRLAHVPQDSPLTVRIETVSPYPSHRFASCDVDQLYELLHSDAITSGRQVAHEVIRDSKPQRLRFDVESSEEVEACGQRAVYVLQLLAQALIRAVDVPQLQLGAYAVDGSVATLDVQSPSRHLTVTLLHSSYEGEKFSAHYIVSGIALPSVQEVRAIALDMIGQLPADVRQLFDTGIYTRNHSLRLAGCVKTNRGCARVMGNLKPTRELLLNTLCTSQPDDALLPYKLPEEQHLDRVVGVLPAHLQQRLDSICGRTYEVREDPTRCANGTWIVNLRRLEPSHCSICNRIHHSENPRVSISDDVVRFNCRRSPHWVTLQGPDHHSAGEVRGINLSRPLSSVVDELKTWTVASDQRRHNANIKRRET